MGKNKIIIIVCCALLLICCTVAGTVAYLTSKTNQANNTFTVGKVEITLDEKDVDNSSSGKRDIKNEYKLVPDQTYDNDSTIHVASGSAESYIFILVQNDISNLEPTTGTIKEQIINNGWKELIGASMPLGYSGNKANTTVYYREVSENLSNESKDYVIFKNFKIDSSKTANDLKNVNSSTFINITGYAIQKAKSLTSAMDAWNNVKDA